MNDLNSMKGGLLLDRARVAKILEYTPFLSDATMKILRALKALPRDWWRLLQAMGDSPSGARGLPTTSGFRAATRHANDAKGDDRSASRTRATSYTPIALGLERSLPPKLRRAFVALRGRYLTADALGKELGDPPSSRLDRVTSNVRHIRGFLGDDVIRHVKGKGYYRPDSPPSEPI